LNDEIVDELLWFDMTTAKNNRLLGKAGVASQLVEVMKTHLQSVAVMARACWALGCVAVDGESRK